MKKIYIAPALRATALSLQGIIAQSNQFDGNSVNLNPETMGDGDGSDAVKSTGGFNVWSDDWSN